MKNEMQCSNKNIIISIIIPVYNGVGIIENTLESIKRQSFKNFQTILVNDASTDGISVIAKNYDVQMVNLEENSGPARARNVGVEHVKGEIVVFLDTGVVLDDPNTLKKIHDIFKEKPDIAGLTMLRTFTPRNMGVTPWYWAMMGFFEWNQEATFHTSFATERSAIRTNILKNIDLFDTSYRAADVEDHEFGFRLFENGKQILIARNIVVSDTFDTFSIATRKMLRRSYYWFRLYLKRRKFDSIWNTKRRALKTLMAGIFLLLFPLGIFNIYFLVTSGLVFLGYLLFSWRFHIWTVVESRRPQFLIPFLLLDLYFSMLILAGASVSLITLLIERALPKSQK